MRLIVCGHAVKSHFSFKRTPPVSPERDYSNIRLNEGACLELKGKGQITLRYKNNRIEFLNGDRCFAHLDVNGTDHAI